MENLNEFTVPPEESKEHSYAFIRHSKASYNEYKKMLNSDDPLKPFDSKEQDSTDLTPEGKLLAKRSAEDFFAKLIPDNVELFFASSNEMRAFETAQIYKEIALEKGFNIIKPINTRNQFNEDEYIRILNLLSINHEKGNKLVSSAFNGKDKRPEIAWDNVEDKTIKDRYERLCSIIDNDDQGDWGSNWYKYGEYASELFPEFKIQTKDSVHLNKFTKISRLIKFVEEKIKSDKKLVILGFGHEDILMKTLKEELGRDGMKNCEVVELPLNLSN